MPIHSSQQLRQAPWLALLQCIVAGFAVGVATTIVLALLVVLFDAATEAHAAGLDRTDAAVWQRDSGDPGRAALLLRTRSGYREAPRLETDVDLSVTGMAVRGRVRQTFRNNTNTWQEGIYVFPLPDDAAVDHLRMQVGKRRIEGRIRERTAARRAYAGAAAAGRRASLVEQERPNVFTTSVANIAPGGAVTVEIEYQQAVAYDNGRFSLRLPLVVGPRYIPGTVRIRGLAGSGWAANTDTVPDAARITPPVLKPGTAKQSNRLHLEASIDAGFALESIVSPYHHIRVRREAGTRYQVSFAGDTASADRDFALRWTPQPAENPRAALFTEKRDDATYTLLMLVPAAPGTAASLPREIVFVIDTSGSMAGPSITQAREALDLALTRLAPSDRFNIIQFNSVTDALFPDAVPATRANTALAQRYVDRLRATGGTEMAGALRAALDGARHPKVVRQVVFLTDGSVGNESQLFSIIRARIGDSRLFTVGIGSAPNAYFMHRAAAYGRGTSVWIGNTAEVRDKMASLLQKLERPALTDIRVQWPDDTAAQVYPSRLPDLYAGEPLVLAARLRMLPDVVRISGRRGAAPWSARLALDGGHSGTGMAVLWARRKIAALTDAAAPRTEASALRAEIVATALRYHLVSRYTSLVAVEQTPVRPASAPMHSSAVPTPLPTGWQYDKVVGPLPRTGTPAGLDLVLGWLLLLSGIAALLLVGGRRR